MGDPSRVGSVAWHRAQGTNKGAGGPGKSGSPAPKPSPRPTPKPAPRPAPSPRPSPKPSPRPMPKPSSPRPGSVAYNRAHGLNKAAGGPGKSPSLQSTAKDRAKQFQNTSTIPGNSPRPNQSVGRQSVSDRRAAAKAAGMTMSEYKKYSGQGQINKVQPLGETNGGAASGGTGNSLIDQYGSGLQGYTNWWNKVGIAEAKANESEYKKNNPLGGLATTEWNTLSVGDNGLFNWDSRNPMNALNVDMMKKFGIKGGDKIFDPDTFQSINNYQGATTDGRLNAHYYDQGLAMALRTDAMGGQMEEHNAQMRRNELMANADGTKLGDASGLFQDRYAVGYHGADDQGVRDVGSHHHESINQAIQETGGDLRKGIDRYIQDGGYAGDALKLLDSKHKQNLTNEKDIKWYNSLIAQAQEFDWEKENQSWGGDAGQASYDVRAGGMSQSSINAMNDWYDKQDQIMQNSGAFNQGQPLPQSQVGEPQQPANSGNDFQLDWNRSYNPFVREKQVGVRGVQTGSAATPTNPFAANFRFNPTSFNFNQ